MTLPSKESPSPPRESQNYMWVNNNTAIESSPQNIPTSSIPTTESSPQNMFLDDVSPSGAWEHPAVHDEVLNTLGIPEFPTLLEVLPGSPTSDRPRFQLRPRLTKM